MKTSWNYYFCSCRKYWI